MSHCALASRSIANALRSDARLLNDALDEHFGLGFTEQYVRFITLHCKCFSLTDFERKNIILLIEIQNNSCATTCQCACILSRQAIRSSLTSSVGFVMIGAA